MITIPAIFVYGTLIAIGFILCIAIRGDERRHRGYQPIDPNETLGARRRRLNGESPTADDLANRPAPPKAQTSAARREP